jgi:DnaJ like chaperone protein
LQAARGTVKKALGAPSGVEPRGRVVNRFPGTDDDQSTTCSAHEDDTSTTAPHFQSPLIEVEPLRFAGKLVGGILGLATGLGPVGALVGFFIGHAYDESMARDDEDESVPGDAAGVREVFFRTTFAVMGCVAKADGRVSEQDIAAARHVFSRLRLGEAAARVAIDYFNLGKQPEFRWQDAVAELRRSCGGRHDLLRMFMEIELRAALLGNGLVGPVRALLLRIAGTLGISGLEFAHLEAVLRLQGYGAGFDTGAGSGEWQQGHQGYQGYQGRGTAEPQAAELMTQAYEILEVASTASDAEVTKAYRRQMSQNHPDKLVARGLPESMLEIAKEKTQAIQAAYERVRTARGMR